MSQRKTINLTQPEDIEQWNDIKMHEQQRRDNPDLKDTELLRDMMDQYEETAPPNSDTQ